MMNCSDVALRASKTVSAVKTINRVTQIQTWFLSTTMAKGKAKKKGKEKEIVEWVANLLYFVHTQTHGSSTGPRWLPLPPEIIWMILQFLRADKASLRACSLATREFRHAALLCLGRHLTVSTASRLKRCAQLLAGGAFQHIRSLDLGVNDKKVITEGYWKNHLVVLGAFARYHALNRLWLSEVPFRFLRPSQRNDLRETITALGSTVTELGLYGCHFSSYEEMISLIRSFPHCNFLFIRNCVTGEQTAGGNAFAGLPEHTLDVKDLQLSSPSSNVSSIDISNLIEDAALNVRSLTALVCDVGTSERTQRVAAAVSASPVEQFQVACAETGGFQGRRTLVEFR